MFGCCVFVCAIADNPLPGGLKTCGQRADHLYWNTSRSFQVFTILMIFFLFLQVLGSLQTSPLSIMRELARGWSVAVAVCFSDRWQVTGDRFHATRDMWQLKCDTWHIIHDMWHLTPDICHNFFHFVFSFFIVSVSLHFGIGATIRTHGEIQFLP